MIPGGAEWIIIGGVVLVLFGASAIPRFARSIGPRQEGIRKGPARRRPPGGRTQRRGKRNPWMTARNGPKPDLPGAGVPASAWPPVGGCTVSRPSWRRLKEPPRRSRTR